MQAISQDLFSLMTSAAESWGLEIRTDYSGRCMYGRKCIGVTGQREDIMAFLKDLNNECHYADNSDDDALFEEWNEMCFDYSQDNMGLDIIIYWSNIEAPEEEN